MRRLRLWPLALLVTTLLLAGCGSNHATVIPANPAPIAQAVPKLASPYAKCTPLHSPGWWTVTFPYTGKPQAWTVPAGVTRIEMIAMGAQGSNALGGCESNSFAVTPGEQLGIFVGGQGTPAGAGGYNGGGNGGAPCCPGPGASGGGGGGASDVREGGMALANRILVAGGGGGSSGGGWAGGTGGGDKGGNGHDSPETGTGGFGQGGTQTQGGAAVGSAGYGTLGAGGDGEKKQYGIFGGGGGGGGYYGGGGGRASYHDVNNTGLDIRDAGGGGGSGFNSPKGINPGSVNGVRYGDGAVRFEWPQQIIVRATGLREPKGVYVDVHGTVYVAVKNSSVTTVSANGTPGSVGSGFERPYAITVDPGGNVYVSDIDAQKVWKVSPPFTAPSFGTKKEVVSSGRAYGIAIDGNGNLYVPHSCGYGCGEILKIAFDGKETKIRQPGFLREPLSVAVNASCTSSNCPIYVVDTTRIAGVTFFPIYEIVPGGSPQAIEPLNLNPHVAMAVDATGALYMATGDRVTKYPFGGPSEHIGGDWKKAIGVAVPPECISVTIPCPVVISDEDAASVTEVR